MLNENMVCLGITRTISFGKAESNILLFTVYWIVLISGRITVLLYSVSFLYITKP